MALEVGMHLPLAARLREGGAGDLRLAVEAAEGLRLSGLAASDRLAFPSPWLDGLVALAAAAAIAPRIQLVTAVALVSLRGAPYLASALDGLAQLSDRPLIAGVGAGAAEVDFLAARRRFADRWTDFDSSVVDLRDDLTARGTAADVWVGSWGSGPGLARVAAAGGGWLASAVHTSPPEIKRGLERLAQIAARPVPVHVTTMWLHCTESSAEAEAVARRVAETFGPRVNDARLGLCIGSADHCARVIAAYDAAGVQRMYVWPVGSPAEQLTLLVDRILSLAGVDFVR